MRYLTLVVLIWSTASHAAPIDEIQKVAAIQQASIQRLECKLKALADAQERTNLSCRTVVNSGVGAMRATCDADELLTGGGGSGPWSTAITDSAPNGRQWVVNTREVAGPAGPTSQSYNAFAQCCKLVKPVPVACP